MNTNDLLQKLKSWRRATADTERVASFRVFSNKILESIAEFKPKNKDELLTIKGIREKKFARYGKAVLNLVNGSDKKHEPFISNASEEEIDKPLSVGKYLNLLNEQLSKYRARIQGEISSLDVRNNVIYFSLKDSEDGSVLSCLIWKRDYQFSGVEFEVGTEIILEGYPEVYKPSGRLSFKASVAELVGEGALKKAYDRLKKKLEIEGLFSPEQKKPIPDFPQKLGLITSETGAVIHDFLTNLGRYGFQIKFMDSKVEGQTAVRDLISAIDYFNGKDIDILVIIRGGGSLESLQAFNNEILVRKIADFNRPVICGIGHEKDVPLASLAADKMVSTPTAATQVLNESWQRAIYRAELNKEKILNSFRSFIFSDQREINKSFEIIKMSFKSIFDGFNKIEESLKRSFISIQSRILEISRNLSEYLQALNIRMRSLIKQTHQNILSAGKLVMTHNPERQLKLGYSIVHLGRILVRKISQINKGQMVNVRVEDGAFESKVTNINKNN